MMESCVLQLEAVGWDFGGDLHQQRGFNGHPELADVDLDQDSVSSEEEKDWYAFSHDTHQDDYMGPESDTETDY